MNAWSERGREPEGREEKMKGGMQGRLCKGESHLLLLWECEIGGGHKKEKEEKEVKKTTGQEFAVI